MPITHDPDFSPSIAQLVAAFNCCADGHAMTDVIEAAANMLSAALHNYGAASGMTRDEVMELAQEACRGVIANVQINWERQRQATDVEVRSN